MPNIFNRLSTALRASIGVAANDLQTSQRCSRLDLTRDLATEAAIAATIDGTPAVLISLWTIAGAPSAAERRSPRRRAA